MNKKAAGHLEMILSFTLFVSFVLFLLVFVKPYTPASTLENSVSVGLHNSFKEHVKTNFTSFFLRADNTNQTADCFFIRLDKEMSQFSLKNSKSLVFSLNNDKLSSVLVEEGFGGNFLLYISGKEKFYNVVFSPEVESSGGVRRGDCQEIVNYLIGGMIEREVVSYSKLQQMKKDYDKGSSSYEALKESLNFPEAYDFSITTYSLNEAETDMKKVIPEQQDVVAEEFLEEVLFSNGELKNIKFNFIVW